MGDHVKVISGRYEGDTGLIVRVEDNVIVLFSDLTMHEVILGNNFFNQIFTLVFPVYIQAQAIGSLLDLISQQKNMC